MNVTDNDQRTIARVASENAYAAVMREFLALENNTDFEIILRMAPEKVPFCPNCHINKVAFYFNIHKGKGRITEGDTCLCLECVLLEIQQNAKK